MNGTCVKHALTLRDAAVVIVKRYGKLEDCGAAKLLIARIGEIVISYRSPFQPLPKLDEKSKYEIARLGGRLNLSYGLDVWAPKKVLNIEWDDRGAFEVISFRRGDWESVLSATERLQ
jgi:hypothetical protein